MLHCFVHLICSLCKGTKRLHIFLLFIKVWLSLRPFHGARFLKLCALSLSLYLLLQLDEMECGSIGTGMGKREKRRFVKLRARARGWYWPVPPDAWGPSCSIELMMEDLLCMPKPAFFFLSGFGQGEERRLFEAVVTYCHCAWWSRRYQGR